MSKVNHINRSNPDLLETLRKETKAKEAYDKASTALYENFKQNKMPGTNNTGLNEKLTKSLDQIMMCKRKLTPYLN